MSSSRVSGTSSGGSHTWWAGMPWPIIRCDRDVEQRGLLALLLGGHRGLLDVGVERLERLHLGDRVGQDPAHVAALVAASRGRDPTGGPETYAALNRSSVDWSGLR